MVLSKIGYWTLAVLAVLIALYGFQYLSFKPETLFEDLRPNLTNHPIPFFVHTTFAPLALIFGVWQFLPVTRRSAWHRWAGRVYVACVAIAGLAGLTVAPTTAAGPWAGTPFAILAVLWLLATGTGYVKVRAGRYAEHRQWMIRSYGLCCAGISLRIIVPVTQVIGLDFHTGYVIAAWGCWTINLVIAELIVRFSMPPASLPPDRRARPPAASAMSAAG